MAGRFDPSKYETVKQRKDRLAQDSPNHVILAVPGQVAADQAWFTVGMWRERRTMEAGAERLATAVAGGAVVSPEVALLIMGPDSLGTAYEAKWMAGASQTSWTENAEESAIGRCLDNAGYHSGGRCSREEILKAQEAEGALKAGPAEDPFGSDASISLGAMPQIKAQIDAMKGKGGVKELRALAMHAAIERWSEAKLMAFAKGVGVDLLNGAKAEDFERVLGEMKKARGVGARS